METSETKGTFEFTPLGDRYNPGKITRAVDHIGLEMVVIVDKLAEIEARLKELEDVQAVPSGQVPKQQGTKSRSKGAKSQRGAGSGTGVSRTGTDAGDPGVVEEG